MYKQKFFQPFAAFVLSVAATGCTNLALESSTANNVMVAPVTSTTNSIQIETPVAANTSTTTSMMNNPEPVQIPAQMANGQYSSLWDVIRAGFSLNHYYNSPKVQSFVQMYTRNPSFIENITTQATPYLYVIVEQLEQQNMPTELALLPIVESGFQPHARSWCGALGLWQLMPAAAKRFDAGNENYWYNARESVQQSTDAALNYLKYLYNFFNGDWMLALAAYNSGEGTVQNAINRNTARSLPSDFWSLNLPSATEDYVPQLLALAIIINDPSHYGIVLPPIPNKPLLGSATIPNQMTLSQAAKFAGINESELKALNPGFTKEITPPKYTGTYSLNLPINSVATFKANCAANPGMTGLERYTIATAHSRNYSSYKVHKGDTLDTVSHFTGVSVATLKAYNHLHSDILHPGEVLRYPVDQTAAYQYITYTVKQGDTLSGIARKYHVNLFNLMQWNDLTSHSQIRAGERLVIRQKISY